MSPRSSVARKRKVPSKPSEEEVLAETPVALSQEEKHQLILAHSVARPKRDPLQRFTLWTGVTIALGAIFVGWVFTVGYQVKRTVANTGSSDLSELTKRLDAFTETLNSDALRGRTTIPNPTSAAAAEELNGILKQILTTPTSSRDDLIAPVPVPSATSSVTAPSRAPASVRRVDPGSMQGLIKGE